MSRIQVTYPDEWTEQVQQRVSALRRRSLSFYCASLIEDDLRASGHLPAVEGSDAALQAQVATAISEIPGFRADLEALLKTARRSVRVEEQPLAAAS